VTGVWVALAISISVSAQTVSYPKIEASFNLTGLATDPFDYTVTASKCISLGRVCVDNLKCRVSLPIKVKAEIGCEGDPSRSSFQC
jgi:hypothetical protein